MGNKYYLKEEACESSLYDIINKNSETHFIPSESVWSMWFNKLDIGNNSCVV